MLCPFLVCVPEYLSVTYVWRVLGLGRLVSEARAMRLAYRGGSAKLPTMVRRWPGDLYVARTNPVLRTATPICDVSGQREEKPWI